MRDYVERGTSGVLGFVLGAAVGAGIALLLAPETGRDTRRRLGQTARRWSEGMKDGVEHARTQMDNARDKMDELKEDVRTAVNTGRETFNRERDARHGTTGNPTTQPIP